MIRRQFWNFFAEINVVAAFVDKRKCVHHGLNFGDSFGKSCGLHQAFKIEHAIFCKIGFAAGNECDPFSGAGLVQRITVKVQNILHHLNSKAASVK